MKKTTFIKLFFATVLFGISSMALATEFSKAETPVETNKKHKSELATIFKNAVGEYPYEVKLFGNPVLRQRMIRLLGKRRFDVLIENFEVQTPIEYYSGAYHTFACQAHNCGSTEFEIFYYPYDDNLCIRYRVDDVESIFMDKDRHITWSGKL